MKSLLGWIRGWRLALLICLLVAAGGGLAYQIWFGGLLRGGDATGLAADERLIPVRRDNLMSEITVNGSIAFTNKKDLTFGSPGFVDEILVTQGEIVSEGQPLARINPESVANLQQSVAQAQLEHTDALNALADARAPTLAVAEAEAAITDAALEIQQARDALDTLVNPPTDTLSQAETAVADAVFEIQQARDALDTLVNPPPNSIADAEEAVAQARLTLQERENSVGSAYADAAATLLESERELTAAVERLNTARDTSQFNTQQEEFDQKAKDYLNVVKKWTGATPTAAELAMPPDDLFAALGFRPIEVFSNNYNIFPNGRIEDNPATRWNELAIYGWRWLYPGASMIEVRCEEVSLLPEQASDTTNTNAELCIERDMDNAYEAQNTARNALSVAMSRYDEGLLNAEVALARAEKARDDARAELARLESGSPKDVLLRRQFDAARQSLAKAMEDLDKLINPDDAEVASKQGQVDLAEAKRAKAVEDLDKLLNPDAAEVASRQGQISLAEAKHSKAILDLERLNARSPLDVTLQEAAVIAAQAKVDGAVRRYDDSTLRAPWDGYVSDVMVEVGEEVEAFKVIAQVINSSIVEVAGVVDEIDVLSLERDTPATVTMDALPEQVLDGTVSSISSTATNQQGVVTFDVKIAVEIPEALVLQDGLSAVAKITTAEQSGLLVPLQAVRQGPDGEFVRVMQDEIIVDRAVRLGNSDGFWAIVEEGLAEGDNIVMRVLDAGAPTDFDDFFDDADDEPPPRRRRQGDGPPPRNQ